MKDQLRSIQCRKKFMCKHTGYMDMIECDEVKVKLCN